MTTTTIPAWQHRYHKRRVVPLTAEERGYIQAKAITVTAGLRRLEGNARPYWSVTCSITEQSRNGRWMDAGGGAAHGEILAAFPELAPVIALHLADDTGTPMHAEANGLYHLGLCRGMAGGRNLEHFRSSWRLTVEQADAIEAYILADEAMNYEAAIHFCAQGERRRWQAESDAARVLLDDLSA